MILVVIADPAHRAMVGRFLDDLNLKCRLYPTWRAEIAATVRRPSCIIADLDNIDGFMPGLESLRRSGWAEPVPLIVLSYAKDVE